jgi:hypothetical protein
VVASAYVTRTGDVAGACLSGRNERLEFFLAGLAMLAAGGHVGVVRDADEMLGLLDAWGIPRERRLCAVIPRLELS